MCQTGHNGEHVAERIADMWRNEPVKAAANCEPTYENMKPNWTCAYGRRGLLVPGKLFILYFPEGGSTAILSNHVPRDFRIFDPKTGDELSSGTLESKDRSTIDTKSDEPPVVVFELK